MGTRALKFLRKQIGQILQTPPKMSIREWADMNRVLSKESSSEHGDWDTSRTPYMIEIYESIRDVNLREIVLQMASQLAKSEVLLNTFGYYAQYDPCPMLLVQPTDTLVKEFSKERVAPMIRDTKVLKNLVKDANLKNSGNTVSHKMFPGGFLSFVGANSASRLASKPIKLLMLDEIDRYPKSAGDEGSPIELAKKRIQTFKDSKVLFTGTPTIKDHSEIEQEYFLGSQGVYYLDCPSCKEANELLFDNLVYEIKKDDEKKVTDVKMSCSYCGSMHYEEEWKKNNQETGRWIHKFPERFHKKSYKLNGLAGVFRTWKEIVEEYLSVKNDEQKYKAFINTVLAETYEEDIKEKIDYELIYARREEYEAEVPEGVLVLTAGIDTQDNYLAIEVVGHGINKEKWGIEWATIQGSFSEIETQKKLDQFLNRSFSYKDGFKIKIYSSCIDSGGHHTDSVYDYVEKRQKIKRIFAIKGLGGEHTPSINKFTPVAKRNLKLLTLGVNSLKDSIYSELRLNEVGEGFNHFPEDIFKNYNIEYFMSLTAEIKEIKDRKVLWKKIRKRNEALDCRGYAIAALKVYKKLDLNDLKKERDKNREYQIPEKDKKRVKKKIKTDTKGVVI
ncbi:MAG: phage terminase large subunit family protein [Fusobacteriaceae bacterium]